MTVKIIGASVVTEQWRVVAATKTKTILVQSKSDDNSIGCQFNLRLRYGVEGVETPIFSQETSTFLEPNQARLIDFRDLVPGDFTDSYPIGAWQIESQIAYNFAPILVRYYEVDLAGAEKAFYQEQLNGKAEKEHQHQVSQIANLETLLLAKLNAPTTPPSPGQILRATGPDSWTWQTVQTGEGGGVILPAEFVTTVNGETGDVVIEPPPLATASQPGLISAQLFALLTGQSATNGQVLQIIGGTPTWGNLTVFATPIQWIKLTANATLEANKNYYVKGGSEFTLPATVAGSVEITNQTTSTITISAGGTARINGIVAGTGQSITSQERVRIRPGISAKLIADAANWECSDCLPMPLSFAYNGTPLSDNTSNPLNAGGILHYFGIVQGGGTWQNPTTGAAATVTAASSGMELGTPQQLSDRVPGGQNIYTTSSAGAWFGWRFSLQARITGFVFQTRNVNSFNPRSWQIRVGNITALINGQDISSLAIVDTRSNQTAVNAAGTYYGDYLFAAPTWGNTVIWQITGNNSHGDLRLVCQEVEFFGDVETLIS